MSDQITYDNKVDLQVATNIANINKVTASDMNEIKNVVNSHADDIDVANNNITDLNNNKLDIDAVLNQASTDTDKPYSADYLNDKLVLVGATAPEKGKNLFDKNAQPYKSNCYIDGSGQEGTSPEFSIFKTSLEPNTTYTLTNSGGSGTPGYALYNASGTRVGGSNYSNISHITFTTTNDTSYMLESVVTDTSSTRYDLETFRIEKGVTALENGERVWFAKGKNLFNKNAQPYKSNCYIDGSGQEGTNTDFSIFKTSLEPNTTYTLTNSGGSGTPGYALYNASGTRVGGSNYSFISHITFRTTSDTSYMLESVVTDTSSTRYDLDIFQIEQGFTATSYEAYINPSINVDGEEWYNKSLAIKTKVYPSITTSIAGYYNLNLKCNKVAIIGFTHDPIDTATILQLYSNEKGWWFIRCSVKDGAYGEQTITNLTIYYI